MLEDIKKNKKIRPYHHIFYFCCPNPVTAHVDDIIKATSDLVVPLLRAISAISSKEVTCLHKDERI